MPNDRFFVVGSVSVWVPFFTVVPGHFSTSSAGMSQPILCPTGEIRRPLTFTPRAQAHGLSFRGRKGVCVRASLEVCSLTVQTASLLFNAHSLRYVHDDSWINDALWAGRSGFYGSIPGGGWEFFSSTPRPERLWGPPNLLSNGYQRLFPWGEAAGAWSWPLTSI
jgi:hypothetical protein